jgi:hypothetical protein
MIHLIIRGFTVLSIGHIWSFILFPVLQGVYYEVLNSSFLKQCEYSDRFCFHLLVFNSIFAYQIDESNFRLA